MKILITLGAFILLGASSVFAQGKLNLYCSADIDWCQLMAVEFEKRTGVNVAMTRSSSGETYAKIRAEKSNPKGDIWWGGTGDPHLQAAGEKLTEKYRSRKLRELQKWAVNQAKTSGYRTVGIYAGGLGISYNSEVMESKKLPLPKTWSDLVNPVYKGHIQMANPNSSGTAYTALASIVQIFGEKKGFDLLSKIHLNVNQYTKSGSAPVKAAARGENTIAIVFMHDGVAQAVQGFPVATIAPSEGTGYEVGSMSIIKGSRNLKNAKKFYDFALEADVQSMAVQVNSFQVPSNKKATVPPQAPKLADIKLIDYDFAKYGSSEERKRLLVKWDADINSIAR